MKFAMQIGEPPRADTRPAGREKAPTDLPGRNEAFDDVLAKVQGETTSSSSTATTASSATTRARSAATDPARSDPQALDGRARVPGGGSSDPSLSFDHESSVDSPDASAVGALLKRIRAKDEAAGAEVSAASTSVTVVAALATPLATPLLAGLQYVVPPLNSDQNPVALDSQSVLPSGNTKHEAASAAPTAKIIVDVAVETHVAPANDRELPADTALAIPKAQEPGSTQPAHLAPLRTTGSTQTKTNGPDAHGRIEDALDDGTGGIAQANPTSVAADGAGTSSGENAPHDRSADRLISRLAEDVSSTSSSVLASQAPAKRIAAAVVELAAQATTAAGTPEAGTTTQMALARTVTLQMSPANLGTVEVRLHLTGQALDLQLTISERETLGLVTRERDALTDALQGQNYEIHSLIIQDGSSSTLPGGTHVAKDNSSGDRPAQQHGREGPGDRTGDKTGDGGGGQDPGRQARSFRHRGEDGPSDRASDSRSLFV